MTSCGVITCTPALSSVAVFNRSYYEAVIVELVKGIVSPEVAVSRYPHQRLRTAARPVADLRREILPPHQQGNAGGTSAGAAERGREVVEALAR